MSKWASYVLYIYSIYIHATYKSLKYTFVCLDEGSCDNMQLYVS